MSAKSLKELPRSSDCSGVPQIRSISDIIQSLKTSFRDNDYSAAVRDLKAREESVRRERDEIVASLREKCDTLDTELGNMRIEKCSWEVECSRFGREYDVLDEKLKEMTREFSLVKENEVKAKKRYGDLLKSLTKVEEDKVRETGEWSDKLEESKRKLAEKEVVIEDYEHRVADLNSQLEDMEEFKRKNERLEEEKLKQTAQLEELERERDGRIKELLDKNEAAKKVIEAAKKAIEAELEARKEKLGDGTRKNAVLEEQKAKFVAQVEELKRYNREKDEKIRKLEREKNDIVKEKDENIKELVKEKESLVMEYMNLKAKSGQFEDRFSKLESDVVTCMTLDLERKKGFASTHVGKILSKIIQALDSEEAGVTCNAGMEKVDNTQEADSTSVFRVSKSKCCLKSEKKSTEDVTRTLFVKAESESPREDEATGSKTANFIIIDSDDEDEKPLYVTGVNNKRKFPESKHDQHNKDGSYDNSLNPKHKIKKLEQVHCEQVKHESSLVGLSAAKNDSKFSTPQKEILAAIRKCEESLRKEVSGPTYSFFEDNNKKSDDSKYRDGFSKPDKVSPQVESYITTHRQRKQNKKLEYAADMVCAFDQDDDLCAMAVCALYRQLKSRSSGLIGSDLGESTKVQECDLERLVALAEFLIDGDSRDKKKKSVVDLQGHDVKGLHDCRRLAKTYCKTLINIYKKGEDPHFSPSSSDLQYT